MNKLGLLKQRGLCSGSCVSTRACNPAPKVPLSKLFWLSFEFVPVIEKISRVSQVISYSFVQQSPTAKLLQSSQTCHLISWGLSDESAEPEVFFANRLANYSQVNCPKANCSSGPVKPNFNFIVLTTCRQDTLQRDASVNHIPSLHLLLLNCKFPYHNFSGHMF